MTYKTAGIKYKGNVVLFVIYPYTYLITLNGTIAIIDNNYILFVSRVYFDVCITI